MTIKAEEISDEAARALLARIALQAIKDYEHAYTLHKRAFLKYARIKRKTYRTRSDRQLLGKAKASLTVTEQELKEVEDFFRTPFGEECSGTGGENAVKMLRVRERRLGLNNEDEIIKATFDR